MTDPLEFGPFLVLDEDARRELLAKADELRYAAGERLIDEEAAAATAYVLLEGTLRVVALAEDRTLAIIGAPALIGEIALVADRARTASVVVDSPATLLSLPGEELRRLMADRPLFAMAMRERSDLLLADAFLKRRSPLRDLPADVVEALVHRLVPRVLAPDQVLEGRDDDLYLVRRGALERLGDHHQTPAGEFAQRAPGERYAAVGETWLYTLPMADVAERIARHQERLRQIARDVRDTERPTLRALSRVRVDRELGGALVYDGRARAFVSERVAGALTWCDGTADIARVIRETGIGRGELVDGLATLVAAGLVSLRRR